MATKNQEHHLTADLLDFFRYPCNQSKWDMAAFIALKQLTSPRNDNYYALKEILLTQAKKLQNNISAQSLSIFSREATTASYSHEIVAPLGSLSQRNLLFEAEKIVQSLSKHGFTKEQILAKTARTLYQKRTNENQKKVKKFFLNTHPLGKHTQIHKCLEENSPKEDIRNKLISLNNPKKPSILFGLLKKAESFSNQNLCRLLGKELFFICKPLGFKGKDESVITVEVVDSSALYYLTYKKPEIIKRLKQNHDFQEVKDIRFHIKNQY